MDLGCLDLGCVDVSDKLSNDTVQDPSQTNYDSGSSQKPTSVSKNGRSRSPKGNGQSILNKFTSQIKKPSHRKNSPLNWFPRKKVDSYLKRKIKMLQEVDGMNLSLDETLGDSNPHFCRVLREKIAAREAADKAMEARKAALVEASWCRILQAARIQSKDAEAKLQKADETAAEAFEAAIAMGVIMFEMTNCPQRFRQIETSTANAGKVTTTHKVTASFETAFEVDKQVAAAVKTAFSKLASCPFFDKEEFKSLLHKISQNPDVGDSNREKSECESESGSEIETQNKDDNLSLQNTDSELPKLKAREGKFKRRQSFEKLNATSLVDMMFERLRCLKEEELSSLATIVATCGLNAALAEVENSKLHLTESTYQVPVDQNFIERKTTKKQIDPELPSLDKFLVKHMTKLEREVLEAKSRQRTEDGDGNHDDYRHKADSNNTKPENSASSLETVSDLGGILVKRSSKLEKEIEEAKSSEFEYTKAVPDISSSEAIPELGSILIKHSSKLEKEIEEERRKPEKTIHKDTKDHVLRRKREIPEVPSLDQYLVKHVSRLEKDVQEAKNRWRKDGDVFNKENVSTNKKEEETSDLNKENVNTNKKEEETSDWNSKQCKTTEPFSNTEDSLDKILVKPVHRLEREKMQASPLRNRNKRRELADTGCESLDKVLVKHMSRLEREKLEFSRKEEEELKSNYSSRNRNLQVNAEASLDEILVKHTSRPERLKMDSAKQPKEEVSRVLLSRREARERELQEAWGGLSLGNSIKPHVSKLERDKAAWVKAEEEERRQANEV